MVLPPNRPGGVRGAGGTTLGDLADLLTEISGKLSLILAGQTDLATGLEAVNDALGTRADCSSGLSVIGLLCTMAGDIGGKMGAPAQQGPPSLCPGYEDGLSYGPVAWQNGQYNEADTPNWFLSFGEAPAAFNLVTNSYRWQDVILAGFVNFFEVSLPELQAMPVCISLDIGTAGEEVELLRFDPGTYEYTSVALLADNQTSGPISSSHTLYGGLTYCLKVFGSGAGSPPNTEAWITVIPE